jgi:putative oxidoreductase
MTSITYSEAASPRRARPAAAPDTDDLAKLLLRLVLGGLLLLHGVAKIQGGIDPILGAVAKAGLPSEFAYLVYVGEFAAPLLLILGIWTRAAALIVVVNMLVAVALVHSADLATLSRSGGWALELQAFYLATALVVALLGAGRYALAVGATDGRWS